MIYFIITLLILVIAIAIVSAVLVIKLEKQNQNKTKQLLLNILDERGFFAHETLVVNKFLSLAITSDYSKLAIIENFNPDMPVNYSYKEISTSFIYSLEKNNLNIRINYVKQGDKNTIYLNPIKKETKTFCYKLFKHINIKKLEHKYPVVNFSSSSASDWCNSFVWAYSPKLTSLAYIQTTPNIDFGIVNLRKSFFTIDIKYNYFETPLNGVRQQLLIYEPSFLDEIFESLFKTIKQKTSNVLNDLIYYDNYSDIVYLSNGTSSLQSILMNDIEEVYFKDNRIYFSLTKEERTIPFIANNEIIKGFEDFLITYNLGKIAKNFDYKTDKLINTTPYTKFIIDFSRDRIVYCANLNKLSQFSYISIGFNEIEKTTIEQSGRKAFVRIYTKNKEIVDVSCTKSEIAHYINAQLSSLIN